MSLGPDACSPEPFFQPHSLNVILIKKPRDVATSSSWVLYSWLSWLSPAVYRPTSREHLVWGALGNLSRTAFPWGAGGKMQILLVSLLDECSKGGARESTPRSTRQWFLCTLSFDKHWVRVSGSGHEEPSRGHQITVSYLIYLRCELPGEWLDCLFSFGCRWAL